MNKKHARFIATISTVAFVLGFGMESALAKHPGSKKVRGVFASHPVRFETLKKGETGKVVKHYKRFTEVTTYYKDREKKVVRYYHDRSALKFFLTRDTVWHGGKGIGFALPYKVKGYPDFNIIDVSPGAEKKVVLGPGGIGPSWTWPNQAQSVHIPATYQEVRDVMVNNLQGFDIFATTLINYDNNSKKTPLNARDEKYKQDTKRALFLQIK